MLLNKKTKTSRIGNSLTELVSRMSVPLLKGPGPPFDLLNNGEHTKSGPISVENYKIQLIRKYFHPTSYKLLNRDSKNVTIKTSKRLSQ